MVQGAREITPQANILRPFYQELREGIVGALLGRQRREGNKIVEDKPVINPKQEDILKANEDFKKIANKFFEVIQTTPEVQRQAVEAAVDGRNDEVGSIFKEMLATSEFGEAYPDFYTLISTIYNDAFVEKFKDLLPKDSPETFNELLMTVLRERAKEVLKGEGKLMPIEGKPVVEAKPASAKGHSEARENREKETGVHFKSQYKNEDDSDFEEWKKGWFLDPEEEMDFARRVPILTSNDLKDVNNLDDLRDVAIQRLRQMYIGNEVMEESETMDFIKNIRIRAETLAPRASKKVKFLQDMVTAMRELHVYWNEAWIGETGGGVGVSMPSIATLAAKYGDSLQGYFNFLLEQDAVISNWHSQHIKIGPRAHKKLSGEEERKSLWQVVGYRMRRMTGQAIYDGIDYLDEQTLDEIINLVIQLQDNPSDQTEIALANKIFGVDGEVKMHSVDYQLYLNHGIPGYLKARYREKFKQRVDYLFQRAEHMRSEYQESGRAAPPGLMTRETYEKLNKDLDDKFGSWNLGEIGAYSMWKRPDTSVSWLNNLSQIVLAVETYNNGNIDIEKINSRERKDLDGLEIKLVNAKNNDERNKLKGDIEEKRKYYAKTRKIFESMKDRPKDLNEFIEKGLNFGMKMISLYDGGQDKRSKQKEIDKLNQRWRAELGFDIYDWTSEALLARTTEEKFKLLSVFLNKDVNELTKQHEIIRNNLIRTVRIDDKIRGKLVEKVVQQGLEGKYRKIKGYVDIPIFQEFIDLDELYVAGKQEGDIGQSWMASFDLKGFSHNAFVIYEGYASKTREGYHHIFDTTTKVSEIDKIREELESAKSYKHLVDSSLAEYNATTGDKEYNHTTTWRIERALDSLQEYVSQMNVLTISMYRKMGVRTELAVHVNDQILRGTNEPFFKHYHFEPAMSEREKAQHVEVGYAKYLELARMNNGYKLRHVFNLLGFKGDRQRQVWETGFLKKLNAGKEEGQPDVSYDALLLMAGLMERDKPKNKDDVRGYRIDEEMADLWFDFYSQYRNYEPSFSAIEQLRPGSKKLILDKVRKELDKGRFKEFKGVKDESLILGSLEAQFKRLHHQFNDPKAGGYFSGIPSYQRTMKFVYERVVKAYIENTFDKSRKIAFGSGSSRAWKKRRWSPETFLLRREQEFCRVLRDRKFAIEGDETPGFNKYILTQVEQTPKGGILYEPDNPKNWKFDKEKGRDMMLDLHGMDEIESWTMGSGELDPGKGKRLTRLQPYFDKYDMIYFIAMIYSAEIAKEIFIHSKHKDWEKGLGGMVDAKGYHVLEGPWLGVITPKKMRDTLKKLIDPGTYSIFDSDEIEMLEEIFGCTDVQVAEFERKRQELGIIDLERGPNQAIEIENAEAGKSFDNLAGYFLEFPKVAGVAELGMFLPGKEELKKINNPKKRGIAITNFFKHAIPAVLCGVASAATPFLWIPVGLLIANYLATLKTTVQNDDFDPHWQPESFFDRPREWAENLTKFQIFGYHPLSSINAERVKARSSYMMIEGSTPLWDDLAPKPDDLAKFIDDLKKKLPDENDTTKSPGGGGH